MSSNFYELRLDIPGHWADGWLYKEHLILWDRVGGMFVCPLPSIAESVQRQLSHELSVVADFLIFRSDWKRSAQFKRRMSIPGAEENFISGFSECSSTITVALDGIALEPVSTAPVPGAVLDSGLYNNCIYIGTTDGLFETRFDPNHPAEGKPLTCRLDKRVRALTARYSVVNASTGKDGLWFSRMSFDDAWWQEQSSPKLVAELSRGNSFVEHDLLNYTDEPFPGYLRSAGEKNKSSVDRESDTWRITGYGIPSDIGGLMKSAFGLDKRQPLFMEDLGGDPDRLEVLGNADKKLLVAFGNSLRVVNLSVSKNTRSIGAKTNKSFQRFSDPTIDPSDIMSTHSIEDGFLVELPDEVCLITSQGSFPLIDEPVARVRTFGHARRYPDVVLMVREDCVSLLGVYLARVPDPREVS